MAQTANETISVIVDGKQVEIPRPEGLMTAEEVASTHVPKSYFESEIARRVKGRVSREELLADQSFVEEVATKHGFVKAGAPEAADLPAFRAKVLAEFERSAVQPLKARAESLESEVNKLRADTLHAEIIRAAAAAGVRKSLLQGDNPMIAGMFSSYFGFDRETGGHYLRDGNGFAPSAQGRTPYVTPSEYIARWAADPQNRDFVEAAQGPPTPSPRSTPASSAADTSGETSRALIARGLAKLNS